MRGISIERRVALSRMLHEARKKAGLSFAKLADLASELLVRQMEDGTYDSDELADLRDFAMDHSAVRRFEKLPAEPLASIRTRAALSAVVEALGLDKAKVNELAGGI